MSTPAVVRVVMPGTPRMVVRSMGTGLSGASLVAARMLYQSEGDPNGIVEASQGSVCLSVDGTTWQKHGGTSNTGWVELRPIVVGPDEPTDHSLVWINTN